MSDDQRGDFSLTRAEFLIGGLACFAAPAILGASSASAEIPAVLPVTAIAPGIWVHNGVHSLANVTNGGDIANIGFIAGKDSVAVIDTGGCAKIGKALLASVSEATGKPVSHVISTHMHPDHVLGNAAFRDSDPIFAGHYKLPRALATRAEIYLESAEENLGAETFAGTEVVLPTLEIKSETQIDLGDRKLVLTPRATAHTNNDLTIRDEQTGTVFMGDLIFAGHVPTLDGSLLGWLKLLEALKREPAERIVPGHGPASMSWPAGADDISRYFNVLADDVRALIAKGETMTTAMETAGQSERGKWEVFDEHHKRNVSAAFAELEWE